MTKTKKVPTLNIVRTGEHIKSKPKREAAPRLSYHGGKLLPNVEITSIYWGSVWGSDPLRTQMDEFFDFAPQSSLVDQLSEYSAGGQTIGRGKHTQTLFEMADPPRIIDDTEIQTQLDIWIHAGTILPRNKSSVCFVLLPSGVTVTLQGASSCQNFCGYHNISGSGVVYAVDTYDDCPGCQFVPGDVLASSTVVASHELCESITDPALDAWFDDANGEEIGDICEGSNKVINTAGAFAAAGTVYSVSVSPSQVTLDGTSAVALVTTLTPIAGPPPPTPPPPTPPPPGMNWTVQKEWSNSKGACV